MNPDLLFDLGQKDKNRKRNMNKDKTKREREEYIWRTSENVEKMNPKGNK